MEKFYVNPIGSVCVEGEKLFLKLDKPYIKGLQALEGFSHLNVLFWFNKNDKEAYRTVVEALSPYKGSPEIMGTFATRGPFRPNPIGLTTVDILMIDEEKGIIEIPFIDADDGSPILDLKPYTPSLDRIENPKVPDWCAHWPKSSEASGDFDWENEFNY